MTEAWDRLWTPYRMAYIRGEGKPSHGEAGDECPFCRSPGVSDAESLVVARGEVAYVVLNLYPYNAGHLLVCPYRHVADYTDLTDDERTEVAALTQDSMRALRTASSPHGFNLGMNQGSVAGAGIGAHLHQHVVPRWGGDTNFMPTIGATKVMPALLEGTRDLVRAAWPSNSPGIAVPPGTAPGEQAPQTAGEQG